MGTSLGAVLADFRDAFDRTRTSQFGEEHARRLRAERVAMVTSSASTLAACNIAYTALVLLCYWGQGADVALSLWAGLMVALNGFAAWRQFRRDPAHRPSGSPQSTLAIARAAAIQAGTFSLAPFFLIPITTGAEAVVLGGMCATCLVVGPYIVHAVPRASLWWLGVSTALNTISFVVVGGGDFAVAGLIGIVIAVGVARACLAQSERLTEQFANRLALERHGRDLAEQASALRKENREVIALLLEEYEEGAGAWLWDCDEGGTLVRISDQFVRMLPPAARMERSLFSLTNAVAPDHRARVRAAIANLLHDGASFHDLVFPIVTARGEERWLSARGRARTSEDGRGGFRGVVADVTDAKRAEDRVRFLAAHDPLTELPNRITFAAHTHALTQSGQRFASLHIDLDRFKLINDTLGHVAGDELLVQVGARLRDACGSAHPEAIAARMGGDEFVACVPLGEGPCDGTARALARAIIERMAKPFALEAGSVTIGASAGFAVWPDDGPLRDLPPLADLALYRAKKGGRGQFQRYAPEMDRPAQDRKELEADLRGALERGEMHVVFQPVVNLSDGCPTGVEALLRWTHPTQGPISPATFVPITEESGMIVEIGAWVLREACREAASWAEPLTVAVNVSPRQMLHAGFVDTVLSALATTGLSAERLELELTESILIEDPERAQTAIDRLRRIGCRVVLDDFGTGYSSLSYLQSFEFDKIKVDRSFIAGLRETQAGSTRCSASLVEAIVAMARTLGVRITAEGIEKQWQWDDLRGFGCDHGQGYLYSKPVPASALPAAFRKREENADKAKGGAEPQQNIASHPRASRKARGGAGTEVAMLPTPAANGKRAAN